LPSANLGKLLEFGRQGKACGACDRKSIADKQIGSAAKLGGENFDFSAT